MNLTTALAYKNATLVKEAARKNATFAALAGGNLAWPNKTRFLLSAGGMAPLAKVRRNEKIVSVCVCVGGGACVPLSFFGGLCPRPPSHPFFLFFFHSPQVNETAKWQAAVALLNQTKAAPNPKPYNITRWNKTGLLNLTYHKKNVTVVLPNVSALATPKNLTYLKPRAINLTATKAAAAGAKPAYNLSTALAKNASAYPSFGLGGWNKTAAASTLAKRLANKTWAG